MNDLSMGYLICGLAALGGFLLVKASFKWGGNAVRSVKLSAAEQEAYKAKFHFVEEVLQELNIPYSTLRLGENEIVLYQEISNKVQNIGRHYFKVVDVWEERKNSLGEYKESWYRCILKTYVNPDIVMELWSEKYLQKEDLQATMKKLIHEHMTSTKMKEALQLHNF